MQTPLYMVVLVLATGISVAGCVSNTARPETNVTVTGDGNVVPIYTDSQIVEPTGKVEVTTDAEAHFTGRGIPASSSRGRDQARDANNTIGAADEARSDQASPPIVFATGPVVRNDLIDAAMVATVSAEGYAWLNAIAGSFSLIFLAVVLMYAVSTWFGNASVVKPVLICFGLMLAVFVILASPEMRQAMYITAWIAQGFLLISYLSTDE